MATSGFITDSYAYSSGGVAFTDTLSWSLVSQSFERNSSTVLFTFTSRAIQGGMVKMGNDTIITINGTSYIPSNDKQINVDLGAVTIWTKEIEISHNNSSSIKKFDYSFTYEISNKIATSDSGSISLDAIALPSTAYKVDPFTDEQYPIVNYHNYTATPVDAMYIGLSTNGIDDNIVYYREGDRTKESGTYHLNLNETEKNRIRNYLYNRVQGIIYILIRSRYKGQYAVKPFPVTVTIVNSEPTIEPIIYDTNSTTTNLTGDNNKIIKYHSNVSVNLSSTAKKGAYILGQTASVSGRYAYEFPIVFEKVDSSIFTLTATDSRNLTTTSVVEKPFINYVHLTCNLEVPSGITTSGTVNLKISGNCFYGSFGSINNSLTLKYRYNSGGSYSSWKTVSVTIKNNNTYEASVNVTGLDYRLTYTFEAYAEDALEDVYSAEVKSISTPVFDWSKDDFNFNVPVNFSAGFTQPTSALKQLWNGNFKMESSSASINLIELISDQPNGIVLVFTPYDNTNNVASDDKPQSFFVSKKVVAALPRKLHTFFLQDGANFAKIGAKSLYIADEKISGYANNIVSGTANGITYNNNNFVLRYIFGV